VCGLGWFVCGTALGWSAPLRWSLPSSKCGLSVKTRMPAGAEANGRRTIAISWHCAAGTKRLRTCVGSGRSGIRRRHAHCVSLSSSTVNSNSCLMTARRSRFPGPLDRATARYRRSSGARTSRTCASLNSSLGVSPSPVRMDKTLASCSGAEVVQAVHRPYSGGSSEVRTYIVAFLQMPNCSERRG
jgi:hypothetical protein